MTSFSTPENGGLLEQAIALQNRRHFGEAEISYRRILAKNPDDVDALQLLAYLMLQNEQPAKAIPLYERAYRLAPQPAFRLYLGEALYLTDQTAKALPLLEDAVRDFPLNPEVHFYRGLALRKLGRPEESLGALRQAITCDPQNQANIDFLAQIILASGLHQEGIEIARQLLLEFPSSAPLHYALGASLGALDRYLEAEPALKEAVRLGCDLPEVHNLIGLCARKAGRHQEAIDCCQRALQLRPDFVAAMNNLALCLSDLEHFNEAIAIQCHALKISPDFVASLVNLASCLVRQGKIADSIKFQRRAVELSPAEPAFGSNVLLALNYDASQSPEQLYREHLAYQERLDRYSKLPAGSFTPALPVPGSRIRIGFVSADLRSHSVAYWIEPLFAHLDRNRCEIVVFDHNEKKPDNTAARLRRHCAEWTPTATLAPAAILQAIRDATVHVLIDLSGHTARNLLPVFDRRAAAVQLSFLGYPNTTGLRNMDGRLTDALADPVGVTDQYHSERLYRFASTAWCYQPPPNCPEPALAPRDHIVFGCFNSLAKIQPPLVQHWAEIMKRVPGSRFYLKSGGLQDPVLHKRFVAQFAAFGIPEDRLHILGRVSGTHNHLACYHEVDIALDSFPYHGTTTTAEALWMGVPTITLAGTDHRSRVGVSLLTNVGHPEWIAHDWDDYIARAVSLATQPDRLATLRSALREQMRRSPLMDAPAYATAFLELVESALRESSTSTTAHSTQT